MAGLELRDVAKSFGDTPAVKDLTLSIEDGDFVVLLGPSGCGKSTILRLMCGLEQPTKGEILLGDRLVNDVSPRDRQMAFVFQSYALYPHMTVARNISFPLEMARTTWMHHMPVMGSFLRWRLRRQADIKDRVREIGEILRIEELLDRYPRALSGGQRQRVAVGRAMVRQPEMFLLDEPLSNLDAKLRVEMRTELIKLHNTIGGTFVYVTHDQTEAMTMGTKIAVLSDGVLQQFDTPRKIFDEPANTFVARFVGIPPMNLVEAEVKDSGRSVVSAGQLFEVPQGWRIDVSEHQEVLLGFRPEHTILTTEPSPAALTGSVSVIEQLGSEAVIGVALEKRPSSPMSKTDGTLTNDEILVRSPGVSMLELGDRVWIKPDMTKVHLFDLTGRRMAGARSEIPESNSEQSS